MSREKRSQKSKCREIYDERQRKMNPYRRRRRHVKHIMDVIDLDDSDIDTLVEDMELGYENAD